MTTLTIQLTADTERKLREKAARVGTSLETYLQGLVDRAVQEDQAKGITATQPGYQELPAEEWIAEWRAWVNSRPIRPAIADDSRESIYEGRGE